MTVEVDVRPSMAPDGRTLVLIQLPHGYVLLTPSDARTVADAITLAADEIDHTLAADEVDATYVCRCGDTTSNPSGQCDTCQMTSGPDEADEAEL